MWRNYIFFQHIHIKYFTWRSVRIFLRKLPKYRPENFWVIIFVGGLFVQNNGYLQVIPVIPEVTKFFLFKWDTLYMITYLCSFPLGSLDRYFISYIFSKQFSTYWTFSKKFTVAAVIVVQYEVDRQHNKLFNAIVHLEFCHFSNLIKPVKLNSFE